MDLLQEYQSRRVLVAEDNPGHQRMIVAMLRALGINPHLVGDGQQALAAAEGSSWDLILMDITMPVMDGVTAVRWVRAGEKRNAQPRTPIFMVTSQDGERDARAARTAGADGHIAKPLTLSLFLGAVDTALKQRRRRLRQESAWLSFVQCIGMTGGQAPAAQAGTPAAA